MAEQITNVSQFLTEDHTRIEKIILELISLKKLKTFDLIPPVLKKLRWQLERHFYVEEKALSVYCELLDVFNDEFRNDLINQHDSIMEMLSQLEANVGQQILLPFEELKIKIKEHVVFETKFFYNELDNNLNFAQKDVLINSLQHDVSKGYYPLNQIRKFADEKAQEHHKKTCNI